MDYRHLAAEYIGVPYDNAALLTSGVSAAAWRLDDSQYHGIIKKVISVESTSLVEVINRGSGNCTASILYSPPVSSDKKYNVFGEREARYPVTFHLQPYTESNGDWIVDSVQGGQGIVALWHSGIGQLYAMAFANLMQNSEIKQKVDQLRGSAAGESRTRQQAAGRETQLAAECKSRGGFWGHHEVQRQYANGEQGPSTPTGDPDHCIMN